MLGRCERPLLSRLRAPIPHWESEIYSTGKIIRSSTGWSSLLPVGFMSDHGVSADGRVSRNEVQNQVPHLVWHAGKAQLLREKYSMSVIESCHPWVFWRKENEFLATPNKVVTFIPHSTPEIGSHITDQHKYITEIIDLYGARNVVLCFQYHDVVNRRFEEWLKYGLTMTTAGNSLVPTFVDRFHAILQHAELVTTSGIGSHVYFALAAGIRTEIRGHMEEIPKKGGAYEGGSHPKYKFGVDAAFPGQDDQLELLLRSGLNVDSPLVQSLVAQALNQDAAWPVLEIRAALRANLGEVFKPKRR